MDWFLSKKKILASIKKKITSFKQLKKYILKKPPKNGLIMRALYVNQLKLIIQKK